MKNIILSTLFVAPIGAMPAFATEADSNLVVRPDAAQNMQLCLQSTEAPAKAIRACTKAYRTAAPLHDVRSDILTQRGWHKLSAGQYDRAARDFKSAAKLNNSNEFAYLGDGFAAMLQQDYAAAMAFFNDCKTHKKAAPLAYYGLGMTKELAGDISGAREAYQSAAQLSPEWSAPREELLRIKT